jgi:hypothetical protein
MILDMIGTPRTHPRFVADERKSERNFGTALVAVMRPYASAIKSGLDIAAHSITLWAINLHAAGKKKPLQHCVTISSNTAVRRFSQINSTG